MHQYPSGRAAAKADGWCVSCLKREPLPDLDVCELCRERRNQWSRNRNAERPSTRQERKHWQAAFDAAQELKPSGR